MIKRHPLLCFMATLLFFCHSSVANTFKTEQWVTHNGTRVIFYQAMEVPMLDISLAFAAGSAYDGKSYGLSALTTQLLNDGSAGVNASTIAETLADTGAQFDVTTNKDMAILSLRTITQKAVLNKAMALFSQIISQPNFSQDAIDHEKKQLLMAIEQRNNTPNELATTLFFQSLYGNHPYAHPATGSKESLNTIKQKQITQFYQRYFVGNNAVLVFVGAIDSPTAHQLAEQLTQALPKGEQAPPLMKAEPLSKAQHHHQDFPSTQTIIRLGQLGIDHHNPHYFPLIMGNYILGGSGLVSRLAVELREKRGLTYSVDSQLIPMPGPGPFFISLATKKGQTQEVIQLAENILQNFIAHGPSEQELLAAKRYLTGSFPLSLSSNKAIASLLLRMTFYRLPDDFLSTYITRINQVTAEDIRLAFQQEINPHALQWLTVGPS